MGKVVNLLTGQNMEILKNILLSDINNLNEEKDSIRQIVLDICKSLKNYYEKCSSFESNVSSSCKDAYYNIDYYYQLNYLDKDNLYIIKKMLKSIIDLIDINLPKEKEIDKYEAKLLNGINILPDRELVFQIKNVSRKIATILQENEELYNNSKYKEKDQKSKSNSSKFVKKAKIVKFRISMDNRLEQMIIKSEDCDQVKLYISFILDTLSNEIAVYTHSGEIKSKCDEAYGKISSLNNNTDLSKINIANTIKTINDIIENLIKLIYEEDEKKEIINDYETRILEALKIIPDRDLVSRLQLISKEIAIMLEENEIFWIYPNIQDSNKPQTTDSVKSANIIPFHKIRRSQGEDR